MHEGQSPLNSTTSQAGQQSEAPSKPAHKDRPLPPNITPFKELIQHAGNKTDLSTQFTQHDDNTYSMRYEGGTQSDGEDADTPSSKDRLAATEAKDRQNTSKNGQRLLPDISEFESALQSASLIPVHHFQDIPIALKEVLAKHAAQGKENQVESYLFRTQLGKESNLDILLNKDDKNKMVIRLFAEGEMSELLLQNKDALLAHLKKKGMEVADVVIEAPPERNGQQGSQDSHAHSNGHDDDESGSEDAEEFVL